MANNDLFEDNYFIFFKYHLKIRRKYLILNVSDDLASQ